MNILILKHIDYPENSNLRDLYNLIEKQGATIHFQEWEGKRKSDRKIFEDDVVDLIRDRNFDIIINEHAECLPMAELCWEAKKRTGIKILAFFNEEPVECKAVKEWKEAFHMSDLMVFPSASNLYRFAKLIQTEHTGLMTTLYPLDFPLPTTKKEKKNQVVYVGRFKPLSAATDLMIKAWATVEKQVSDWELICIGQGEDIANAKKKCEKRRLHNISFVGMEDPTEYLDTAKIIIFPEYHNKDVALSREAVLRHCIPCYAESSDREEFAESILSIMKNPKEHDVKPYTEENIIRQWKYITSKLMSMTRERRHSSHHSTQMAQMPSSMTNKSSGIKGNIPSSNKNKWIIGLLLICTILLLLITIYYIFIITT